MRSGENDDERASMAGSGAGRAGVLESAQMHRGTGLVGQIIHDDAGKITSVGSVDVHFKSTRVLLTSSCAFLCQLVQSCSSETFTRHVDGHMTNISTINVFG
jgi:uncharacterized Fe-S center protein